MLILGGELQPGQHIGEQSLAARLGVGRTPVREALRALERAGLVITVRNRGVFVREVTLRNATDVFDIRAEISAIVAREAVQNVSPRAVTTLTDLIGEMDVAAATRNADRYLDLNLQFHESLYALADNRRIAELDRSLGNELLLYRRRGLASGGGLEVSNREHRGIVETLQATDAERLTVLLREHILGGKRRFLAAIAQSDAS